jgi:hypothetical protein
MARTATAMVPKAANPWKSVAHPDKSVHCSIVFFSFQAQSYDRDVYALILPYPVLLLLSIYRFVFLDEIRFTGPVLSPFGYAQGKLWSKDTVQPTRYTLYAIRNTLCGLFAALASAFFFVVLPVMNED